MATMRVVPQAYSPGTGGSGPRAACSNSSSDIGRKPAQSASAVPSSHVSQFMLQRGCAACHSPSRCAREKR
ncbi:MAG TPA: hypothetical protein VEA40_10700 [Ramlibacter sp.]|nr:hypothetical protein [Ramlibacter sp.]